MLAVGHALLPYLLPVAPHSRLYAPLCLGYPFPPGVVILSPSGLVMHYGCPLVGLGRLVKATHLPS